MSKRDGAATVKDRIEDVRRHTAPPNGRQARKGYISKDDFAELLGVSRSAVYNWTREPNPSYPDEAAREALARLSQGRYRPDDFQRSREAERESLERRVAVLEELVGRLERHILGEDAAQG